MTHMRLHRGIPAWALGETATRKGAGGLEVGPFAVRADIGSHFKIHGFQTFALLSPLSPFSLFCSVLDLNAFERQNKAEGLGMVTEEGSGMGQNGAHAGPGTDSLK